MSSRFSPRGATGALRVLSPAFALVALAVACGSSDEMPPRSPDLAIAGDGGSGGSSGGSGSGGGSGGSSSGPIGDDAEASFDATPIARPCDALADAGVWENITPPEQPIAGDQAPCPYGGAFVMDPHDPSILIVGSCNQGIWRSTDCGSTWKHVNTGKNGAALDIGRQWTFVIDPVETDTIYTNAGYSTNVSGAYKSTNGGVDWTQIWPPADPSQQNVVQNNFVGQVVMDPTDRHHLLMSFHAACNAPHPSACLAESHDAGGTWSIVDLHPEWTGGEAQVVYFLESGTSWLWGSQTDGLWHSADGAKTWTQVSTNQGHATGQLYRAKNGTFYLPQANGIIRSPDGITWTEIPNSGNTMYGVIGNGTTMFASRGFPWDPSSNLYEPFWTSPEGDGLTWTQMQSPQLENGGQLEYDSVHHLLYSSNLGAGVWRVVTGP